MCQNQKINAWINDSNIEGFLDGSYPANNKTFNFGQFNVSQMDILKLIQTQYLKNQPRDEISKDHAPRIQDQSCDKPTTCPKCNETPYCTSSGWACDTMNVESTDYSCIQ